MSIITERYPVYQVVERQEHFNDVFCNLHLPRDEPHGPAAHPGTPQTGPSLPLVLPAPLCALHRTLLPNNPPLLPPARVPGGGQVLFRVDWDRGR